MALARDLLRSLGWASGAVAVGVILTLSGLLHGIGFVAALLFGTPVAAGRFHRSPRVGGLVAVWLVAVVVFGVWRLSQGLEGFRLPGR